MLKLRATPRYLTVGVNEKINFSLESDDLTLPLLEADEVLWASGEVTDEKFVFHGNVGVQPGARPIDPVRGNLKHQFKFDRPGKYQILATLEIKDGDFRRGQNGRFHSTEYYQNVQPTASFMWDPVNKQRTHAQDPASALSGLRRYINTLSNVGAPLMLDLTPSGQAQWQKHQKVVERYEEHYDKLKARLDSTADWVRIPLTASHRPDGSGKVAELNIFLAHEKNPGTVKRWKVVDWTHPGDRNLDGEYDGKGLTDAEAANAAIKAWQDGNRYPPGQVTYEVPAHVLEAKAVGGHFITAGLSFLGKIADFLEKAGIFLAIVAFILAIAPIPGSQAMAAALVIGVFSGALGVAAGALNIAERHGRGVADANADVIDGLTMVGSMLGASGSWVRGAKLALRVSGSVRTMVLVGEIGNASLQGIMVAEASMIEIERLINDKTLSPDERIRRLLSLTGRLAAQGALLYINIKGTAKDIARINTPKPPPPKKLPPPSHGERLDGTPEENFKKLADKEKTLDLTEEPAVTGKTAETPHTTVVRGEQPRVDVPRQSFDQKFLPDKDFWRSRVTNNDKFISLAHKVKDAPNNRGADMSFGAAISDDGVMRVVGIKTSNWRNKKTGELITDGAVGAKLEAEGQAEPIKSSYPDGRPALVAKELYPMMFDHFEAAARRGGTPIKGIEGEFTLSNYLEWKAAVKAGADPSAAILEKTKTGPLWKTELDGRGYKYKMAAGFPRENAQNESVSFEFEVSK